MQINKITYSTNIQTYPANQNAQGQNFQGARLNEVKAFFTHPGKKRAYVQGFVENVNWLLGTHDSTLSKYATFNNQKRTAFFYKLAEKLNTDIFTQKIADPKNKIAILDDMYNTIPNPQRIHFSILNNNQYSFEEASQILKLISDNKDKTELYSKLKNIQGIFHNKITLPAQSMIDILSSEHAAKLNKDIDTYSSYITLNYKKEGFTQELLAELAADKPSFDVEKLNKTVTIKISQIDSTLLKKFSTDELLESYNTQGFLLFKDYNGYYNRYLQKHETVLSPEDKKFLQGIIKTTTPENLRARQVLLYNLNSLENKEDIARMLEKFDNDKYYGEIYENITQLHFSKLTEEPLDKIMYYIDSFGSKTVLKNFNRFAELTNEHIADDIPPEETVKLISKNLINPFYQSRRQHNNALNYENDLRCYQEFGNTKAEIARMKRKIKFTLMPKIFGTGKPAPINPNATYRKAEATILHQTSEAPITTLPVHVPKQTIELPPLQTILEREHEAEPIFKLDAPKAQLLLPAKVKIKRDYKARKLQIQQDAQEIIKSRMKSTKQIQEQIGDYSKRATKMRNQFLNEMFNSVAETRAQQRAQGIKRPTISNADVLEVYQKINGKNKKLFKYLLNSRKENGEREFDLKQIGKILDEVKTKRPPEKR